MALSSLEWFETQKDLGLEKDLGSSRLLLWKANRKASQVQQSVLRTAQIPGKPSFLADLEVV